MAGQEAPAVVILECPHCGVNAQFNQFGREFHDINTDYAAYKCTVKSCNHCIMVIWHRNAREVIRVWPPQVASPPDHVPDRILDFYREAHDALHAGAPKASLVMARSAIQLTARELGAPKGSLKSELEWLKDNDKIAKELYGVADSIRLFGNEAAHPDPDELVAITGDDAEQLISFLETLLQYVFTLRAELDNLTSGSKAPDASP